MAFFDKINNNMIVNVLDEILKGGNLKELCQIVCK